MDRSRKATRAGNEITLQHTSPQEALLIEELIEAKLAQLKASIEQMKQSPEGTTELQRRVKAFGECQRNDDETSGQFFDKLRRWLDREIPQTKSPLHPPRQVGYLSSQGNNRLKSRKAKAMGTKAGVWIDHKQAIVVLMKDAGQEIKKIAFDFGQPVRRGGASVPKNKYTPNDFVAEDKLERKVEADRKNFYDEVIACIQGADSLLILGPGEAKGEFSKRMKSKKVRGVVMEMETADKLTDRQLAAKVQKHFATSSPKKTVAPKKAAKKAAKATTIRRPKKSE